MFVKSATPSFSRSATEGLFSIALCHFSFCLEKASSLPSSVRPLEARASAVECSLKLFLIDVGPYFMQLGPFF
jgi:hypothetical protein